MSITSLRAVINRRPSTPAPVPPTTTPGGWIYKNTNYSPLAKEKIIADTRNNPITINLPSNPQEGDYITITDKGNWAINNLTINRNGKTIQGKENNLILDKNKITVEFIYTNQTWEVCILDDSDSNIISVKDFGAVGDGITDDTLAVQTALTESVSSGKNLFFPLGNYYFAQNSPSLNPGIGGITIFGDDGTILSFHEGTSNSPKYLFLEQNINPNKKSIKFQNLIFKGTFQTRSAVPDSGIAIFLDRYEEISLIDCKFTDLTGMATDMHFNDRVLVDRCSFIRVCRDCVRVRDCFYTSVTNCFFKHTTDDNIAWHSNEYVTQDNYKLNVPPQREGLIVQNCFFCDTTSNAVSALGARIANISNNIVLRGGYCSFYISEVQGSSAEGINPIYDIILENNIILDSVKSNLIGGLLGIYITQVNPRGTATSNNTIPTLPNSQTGAFELPYKWRDVNVFDSNSPIPPPSNIKIKGNIIGRTLPTVSKYSDWGFGQRLEINVTERTGGFFDPEIIDDDLRYTAGILLKGGINCIIEDNLVSHTKDAIYFDNPSNANNVVINGSIKNNKIYDTIDRGIVLSGSNEFLDVTIDNNHINLDRYRLSSNSNPDGTYKNLFSVPVGIDAGDSKGVIITNNKISNVTIPIVHTPSTIINNNILICQPNSTGSNSNNKGIGTIPKCTEGYDYIIANSDPTSENYGKIINTQYKSSSTRPSSGFWVEGAYVKNTNPVVSGNSGSRYIILGWQRLTTGSNNTLGTDWVECRALTGT